MKCRSIIHIFYCQHKLYQLKKANIFTDTDVFTLLKMNTLYCYQDICPSESGNKDPQTYACKHEHSHGHFEIGWINHSLLSVELIGDLPFIKNERQEVQEAANITQYIHNVWMTSIIEQIVSNNKSNKWASGILRKNSNASLHTFFKIHFILPIAKRFGDGFRFN